MIPPTEKAGADTPTSFVTRRFDPTSTPSHLFRQVRARKQLILADLF
jgi:hypothetical protein